MFSMPGPKQVFALCAMYRDESAWEHNFSCCTSNSTCWSLFGQETHQPCSFVYFTHADTEAVDLSVCVKNNASGKVVQAGIPPAPETTLTSRLWSKSWTWKNFGLEGPILERKVKLWKSWFGSGASVGPRKCWPGGTPHLN